jgi:hypothetical protein
MGDTFQSAMNGVVGSAAVAGSAVVGGGVGSASVLDVRVIMDDDDYAVHMYVLGALHLSVRCSLLLLFLTILYHTPTFSFTKQSFQQSADDQHRHTTRNSESAAVTAVIEKLQADIAQQAETSNQRYHEQRKWNVEQRQSEYTRENQDREVHQAEQEALWDEIEITYVVYSVAFKAF